MSVSGKDRVELMESLSISVIDGTGDDNLCLGRYGIYIPYNIANFMMFSESYLVSDVLRRFREKQMDYPNAINADDDWKKKRHESNVEQMDKYLDDIKPKQYRENNIVLKKKIIRDKLIEKGLMCSDSE